MAAGLDERQERVAQQGEVSGSSGRAPCAAVLTPGRGILAPVVFVFHRPVLTAYRGKPDVAGVAFTQGGQEVAGLAFEVSGARFL